MSTLITQEDSIQYRERWVKTIQEAKGSVSSNHFKNANGNSIYGYKVPITDFYHLINQIGAKEVNAFFGLDEQEKVRLVFWTDNDGLTEQKYYSPDSTHAIQETWENLNEENIMDYYLPHSISHNLARYASQEWVSVSREDTIPQNLFQVIDLEEKEALKGYVFRALEMNDVLLAVSPQDKGLKPQSIYFYFMNHKYGDDVAEGNIGLLVQTEYSLGNNAESNTSSLGATSFDLSIPCPRYCPKKE